MSNNVMYIMSILKKYMRYFKMLKISDTTSPRDLTIRAVDKDTSHSSKNICYL